LIQLDLFKKFLEHFQKHFYYHTGVHSDHLIKPKQQNQIMRAIINLTETMLNKSIIDANKTVRDFAKAKFEFDYDTVEAGTKEQISAKYVDDNSEATVSFYTAKTRGDKRISISGLKKKAEAGQVVSLSSFHGEFIKIKINNA
jgi:hypothetical protein